MRACVAASESGGARLLNAPDLWFISAPGGGDGRASDAVNGRSRQPEVASRANASLDRPGSSCRQPLLFRRRRAARVARKRRNRSST